MAKAELDNFSLQAKISAMDDLMSSGASAVSDPEAALMVTNAIKSIIGDDTGDEGGGGGASSSVGLEVTTKAVEATEVRSPPEDQTDIFLIPSWLLTPSSIWRSPRLTT